MNIFILDVDPKKAARDQCNKHVVKMLLESAQLLSTVLFLRGVDVKQLHYRPTHIKHPSTLWAAKDPANLAWLYAHAEALCDEYTRRYHKKHRSETVIKSMKHMLQTLDWNSTTTFAQAMPEQWKHVDAVTAYRSYYIAEKSRFAKWAPRAEPPTWWPFKEE